MDNAHCCSWPYRASASQTRLKGLARRQLFHADAEPVLQLIQSGDTSLLEGSVPKITEDLQCGFVAESELVGCVGNCLALQIHCRDRLPALLIGSPSGSGTEKRLC